jgi:Flp pilus assembly protein protease CpaA
MALMTAIFIAMGQLNHAIHFYIYTLTGGVFRNELIQLFTFKKKKSLLNTRNNTEQTLLQPNQPKNTNNIDIHGF